MVNHSFFCTSIPEILKKISENFVISEIIPSFGKS